MDEVSIRPLLGSDIDAVSALQARVMAEMAELSGNRFRFEVTPKENESFLIRFTSPGQHHASVAVAKSRVVGYVVAYAKELNNEPIPGPIRVLWVDDIAVEKAYRNHGIGKRLLANCTQFAAESGFPEVWLNVFWFNQDAHGFYSAMGFMPWSTTLRKTLSKEIPPDAWEPSVQD